MTLGIGKIVAVSVLVAGVAAAAAPAQPSASQPPLLVSLEWLQAHVDDPKVAVLDVGSELADFERGHIPRAGFVGHMDTVDDHHRLLAPEALAAALARLGATDDARIVLYGDPMSVGWFFVALSSIGHGGHTSVLDGNLQAWKKAGYAVATGAPATARGRLTVRPPADLVVDGPWVRDHLKDPAFRLLDVRSEREWSGGMIPGATRIRWEDLYADLGTGRFKTPAAIRDLLERAGVTSGRTAVTYCAVGLRASLMYFAARLANVPARVYQGSWNDWRARDGYPVAR